ncbi:hypothetical protein QL285_050152 [Trifolium repens]|nr:hypothetical protein QL285_050152 [Trifolium repens]
MALDYPKFDQKPPPSLLSSHRWVEVPPLGTYRKTLPKTPLLNPATNSNNLHSRIKPPTAKALSTESHGLPPIEINPYTKKRTNTDSPRQIQTCQSPYFPFG